MSAVTRGRTRTALPLTTLLSWGAVLAVALVLTASWGSDRLAADGVQLLGVVRPPTTPADGQSTARLTVRSLDRSGRPRSGDTIEVLAQGAGIFDRFRALTDARGEAVFVFTPARANRYRPAAPVTVFVTNTSLGHLVEVDKTVNVTIGVVPPTP